MNLSRIKKTAALLLAAITLILFVVSCTGDDPAPADVDFDTVCSTAADAIALFDSSQYAPREQSYIENFIKIKPSEYDGCTIRISTEGGSINEYGVIAIPEGGSVKDTEDTIKAYFDFYREIWDDRYTPEEYPKLRDAEVRSFGGKYVVYVIMDKSERNTVFSATGKLFG